MSALPSGVDPTTDPLTSVSCGLRRMFEYAFLSDPNNPGLEIFDIVLTTKDSGSVFTRDVVTSSAPRTWKRHASFCGACARGRYRHRKLKVQAK